MNVFFLEVIGMNVVIQYLIHDWATILILLAFAIMLRITVFLDKKTVVRMYVLIIAIFLLSIIVFAEFYLGEINQFREVRVVMTAIRYSATPLLISYILFTLVKRTRWYVLLPAVALMIINIVSIFTGIVFSINDTGNLVRGPLGYLPYIGVGIYSVVLVYVLILQSNKHITEIIPIAFMAFAFGSGLVLPFVMGKDYSKIFCNTIAIALFVYYVFQILQLTKKDALTGLLNRQAYYSIVRGKAKDITAFISIDMNGLKAINDNNGHLAGDEALVTLAACFTKAIKIRQHAYRIGGDEFVIICTKTSRMELEEIVSVIKKNVSETPYTCSVGYCYCADGSKDLTQMVKESDQMMYADKAEYYSQSGKNRRTN